MQKQHKTPPTSPWQRAIAHLLLDSQDGSYQWLPPTKISMCACNKISKLDRWREHGTGEIKPILFPLCVCKWSKKQNQNNVQFSNTLNGMEWAISGTGCEFQVWLMKTWIQKAHCAMRAREGNTASHWTVSSATGEVHSGRFTSALQKHQLKNAV